MKFNKLFVLGLIVSAVSCGGKNDGGNDDNNNGTNQPGNSVNTANFKNTADAKTFSAKADSAEKIFDTTDKSVSKFNKSNNLNMSGLSQFLNATPVIVDGDRNGIELYDAKLCEANKKQGGMEGFYSCQYKKSNVTIECQVMNHEAQYCRKVQQSDDALPEDEGTEGVETESSTSGHSIGNVESMSKIARAFSGDFKDCGQAFQSLRDVYQLGKGNLTTALASLEKKEVESINGAKPELKPVKDDNAAIAYEYKAPENQQGFEASGSIKGSANDTMMMIEQKNALAIDFSKIQPTGPEANGAMDMKMSMKVDSTIAADLTTETIDLKNNVNIVMNKIDSKILMATTLKGGDLPALNMEMSLSQIMEGKTTTVLLTTSMIMKDANTLAVLAKVAMDGQKHEMAVSLVKAANGTCSIVQ